MPHSTQLQGFTGLGWQRNGKEGRHKHMHRKAGVRWAELSDGEAAATPEKQRVFKMQLNIEARLLLHRAIWGGRVIIT